MFIIYVLNQTANSTDACLHLLRVEKDSDFFYLFLLELNIEIWNFYVFLRSLDCTTSDPIHVIHAFTPGALILD